MSTLSIDPAVSLFEPSARRGSRGATAAPVRPSPARAPRRARVARVVAARTAGTRSPAVQAAARTPVRSACGPGRRAGRGTAQLVARPRARDARSRPPWSPGRWWPGHGGAADVRRRACAASRPPPYLCRLGFPGPRAARRPRRDAHLVRARRSCSRRAHRSGSRRRHLAAPQDHLGLLAAVFVLDVVLVVVPALLGARAGRPEGATA